MCIYRLGLYQDYRNFKPDSVGSKSPSMSHRSLDFIWMTQSSFPDYSIPYKNTTLAKLQPTQHHRLRNLREMITNRIQQNHSMMQEWWKVFAHNHKGVCAELKCQLSSRNSKLSEKVEHVPEVQAPCPDRSDVGFSLLCVSTIQTPFPTPVASYCHLISPPLLPPHISRPHVPYPAFHLVRVWRPPSDAPFYFPFPTCSEYHDCHAFERAHYQ